MRSSIGAAILVAGCQTADKPAARDVSTLVGAASRVAIGDLDGDGRNEVALAGADTLRVVEPDGRELASTRLAAGIQLLVLGDGKLYAGLGQTREHIDGKARVAQYRLEAGKLVEETVLAPETARQDIASIVPTSDGVLVAYFDSKYTVTAVMARRGAQGWTTEPIAHLPMATSWARGDVDGDGSPDLVVGRVYSDDKGSDGDAFLLAPDGARKAIPTTRGVRSLAIADGDIYLGDGWHQHYAQSAHGQLTHAHHTAGGFVSELIEDTKGQFSIERILPAHASAGTVLVTLGSAYVRVFTRSNDHWEGRTIGGAARDIAVGDLDGVAGDEVLIAGEHSEIVKL